MRIRSVPVASGLAGAAALAAAVLAALAAQGAQQDHDGGAGAPAAVRVAFFPNTGHAIPIVGLERGLLPGNGSGLEVEPRLFYSGPQAVESMFAGAMDMAYVGPGPAVTGFLRSGSGIVVLAGAASGGSSLVARPGSGMEGPEDMDGRTVAAPQVANTQDVSLRTYVADLGLETAERGGSVSVLNVANPEIYALFARGDVDAAWVPEPWATLLVGELGGERLLREESLWPDGRFASVLLVARAEFADENPAAVAAWLRAHGETAEWIRGNPEEAASAVDAFMERELRAPLPEGAAAEALSNVEITADPLAPTVLAFAERAERLGYLGRGGLPGGGLDGMFRAAGPAA